MFAALWVPNFRLQAALRFRDELRGKPVALTHDAEGKTGLLEINGCAAKAGVRPGQSSPQALARCPGLVLIPRIPSQEASAQTILLEAGSLLAPAIESTLDGCCTIDLRSRRATPDYSSLLEHLSQLHLASRCGVAPNPDLAFLAARHARPLLVVQAPEAFLANLAIHELDPPPDLLATLHDWGIHNLGQLTSLPRGELMDRLGPDAARLWERAAGRMERPLRLVQPVETFVEFFEFEREIETLEPLLFILRRLLDQLVIRILEAYRVAGALTLTLPLANGETHERTLLLPSPTADAEVLFRVLHTHLDGLQLANCPVAVRLEMTPSDPSRQQFQLFESPLRDPNRFGETLGRLAALVGTENSGVPEVADTHRPDAFRLVPPRFQESPNPSTAEADLAIGLPLRRYRPAVSAEVTTARHQPVFLRSERVSGAVREAMGPYRASGQWWEESQWSVEEWDVELDNGGLYRLSRNGSEWHLTGSYDEPPTQGPAVSRKIIPMHP